MTHLMPAEWEAHEQTWLAFPHSGYTLGESAQDQEVARQTWANVANAASEFEKVTVIVHPEDLSTASKLLSAQIETLESVLDDAWIRDSGPTFVRTTDGALAAVNWVFNGWGGQAWASYENDNLLATKIANSVGVPVIDSKMVNEGGGIHFNGQGKVLLTETVQLDNGRNPGWSKSSPSATKKSMTFRLPSRRAPKGLSATRPPCPRVSASSGSASSWSSNCSSSSSRFNSMLIF